MPRSRTAKSHRHIGTKFTKEYRRDCWKRVGKLALRLLWQALGGEDSDSVSRVLTLDMDSSWIGDTAIVVQVL